MCLLQVLWVLGLIWKCRPKFHGEQQRICAKLCLQRNKKKKAQPRDQNTEMHLNHLIHKPYWILSASEGQLCHLRLLHLPASLYRLIFFLLLFFLHNFHVIVAKLNMCIDSCERKSNFHLLPQTFRKENISSQIFLFTDWIPMWNKMNQLNCEANAARMQWDVPPAGHRQSGGAPLFLSVPSRRR